MIAKIVYYTGLVSMIGMFIGIVAALVWFVITTIPFFLAIVAGVVVLAGFGMLFGWAETQIDNAKKYDIDKKAK